MGSAMLNFDRINGSVVKELSTFSKVSFPIAVSPTGLGCLYAKVTASLNHITYISQQLVHRLALRGATGDSGDFGPKATFFCFMYERRDFHAQSPSIRKIGAGRAKASARTKRPMLHHPVHNSEPPVIS
jgi:hypothetical protein